MAAPPLAIHLFGPLRVSVRGEPLPRVRTRSVEWLLALLTLRHGRAVSRAWLAGTLWPESSQSRGLRNLREDLMRLRKALGPEGERIGSPARDQLTLDLAGAEVDVVRFDRSVQAAEIKSLREAVEVYTGPLLEGCVEEWVLVERESRAEQCLKALEVLAERAEGRGHLREAIHFLRRAEALDPLRDSLQQRLMANLAAAGDPAAAIQTYRHFRFRLQEALIGQPDEATTRLFREIRASARRSAATPTAGGRVLSAEVPSAEVPGPSTQHPAPSTEHAPVGQIPHVLTPLIGREQEIADVREQLRQGRLVTLMGGGGVGKTRLALELAAMAGEAFPSGAVWVELAPLAEGGLVLPALATAFGLRQTGSDDPEALKSRLIARLADDPPLLVLDNCEHLLDAVAAVVQILLQYCPELHVLATSRQRLGLPGEVAWRVPSLAIPDPSSILGLQPSTLIEFAAARLFVERAASARPGFRLATPEDALTVCRICRRLDGIPLALELAAARVRVLTPRQIVERLDDRFNLLTTGARTALPRHQTLRALIDWSYDSLPETEAALLRRLSVFAGGWTLEAAEAVCGDGKALLVVGSWLLVGEEDAPVPSLTTKNQQPTTPFDVGVLDLLDSLEDRSLVLVEEGPEGMRYRMLETVREYAREKLDASGELAATRNQHRDWFLQLAEREAATANLPEERESLLRLEREHDNIRVALRACHEAAAHGGDRAAAEAALRLGSALGRFWIIRGYLAEGLDALETALADGSDLPAAERAAALSQAANLAGTRGDGPRAKTLSLQSRHAFEIVLHLAREEGHRQKIAITLLSLVGICLRLGDLDATWRYGLEARRLLEEVGDPVGLARILDLMAQSCRARGELPKARVLLEERLAICRRLGKATLLVHALGGLGHLERDEGNYTRARSLYAESLLLRRELGDRFALAQSLEDLAVLAGREHQAALAVRLLGAGEAYCETLGARAPVTVAAEYERTVAEGRAVLGEAAFADAWTEGRALSLDEAIACALEGSDASRDEGE